MVLGFVTVPLYVFSILWLMSVDDAWRFKFTPDSTFHNLKAMGDFCVSKDENNVRQWATIEINTFYMTILSLIFSLFIARISEKDHTEEDFNAN